MASPYQKAETVSGSARVFRRKSSVTLEGIEDLLADAANVRDVTPLMIKDLCEQRKIDLKNRLARGRRLLYRRYLCHCLEDKRLSRDEHADLAHLRLLLHLSQQELSHIHDDVAIDVYGEAVHEVLDDFMLDDQEAAFLATLQKDLGLSEDKADRIYREESSMARSRAMSEAASRDHQFILHRKPAGEFTGRSNDSLEGAIEDGLANAALAVPGLYWFEVGEISGYIEEGHAKSWHVTLRAGIDTK
jgi:flavin-binding protein dodecin